MGPFARSERRRRSTGTPKRSNEEGAAPGAGGIQSTDGNVRSQWLEGDDSYCSVSAVAPQHWLAARHCMPPQCHRRQFPFGACRQTGAIRCLRRTGRDAIARLAATTPTTRSSRRRARPWPIASTRAVSASRTASICSPRTRRLCSHPIHRAASTSGTATLAGVSRRSSCARSPRFPIPDEVDGNAARRIIEGVGRSAEPGEGTSCRTVACGRLARHRRRSRCRARARGSTRCRGSRGCCRVRVIDIVTVLQL